jgi:ornithine cyclodeaminase/alanine dehydrogenase-like protein (mu-crystallin family)
MKTRLLTSRDIQQIVRHRGLDSLMKETIRRLREAFGAYDEAVTVVPTRAGFSYQEPSTGLLEWMPVMVAGSTATIKVVGYHPGNPLQHELPTIVSTISVYDLTTGHLHGLLDGVFVTALRTGAASAVASECLAPPTTAVVGLIGAGAQAVTQLHALAQVLPLKRVLVYDINPLISRSFASRVAFMGLDVQSLATPADILPNVDILCTVTTAEIGSGPVFNDGPHRPALHINAVGSDFPGKTEVPKPLLERATVCPDFLEQALKEGECQQLSLAQVGPSLHQLVKAPAMYAHLRDELTVFDSTGWALEDQVVANMMLEYADEIGVGSHVEVELLAHDPLNPYGFINDAPPMEQRATPTGGRNQRSS